MKNKMTKVLISILTLAIFTTSTFAVTPATRIKFAKGAKSASIAGVVPAGSSKEFVVAAKKGQSMTISVASPCKAQVLMEAVGPDSAMLAQDTQYFSGKVAEAGDVKVFVKSSSFDPCRFTVKVHVK